MLKNSLWLILFLLFSSAVVGQDKITMMHYNVLNYGNVTTYCTASNNNQTTKAANLKFVIDHVLPDIFAVNEIGANVSNLQHILDNALNVNGRTYYQKANYSNLSGSDLVNGLFYDSRKFGVVSQQAVPTSVRDINFIKLYYKDDNLAVTHDTAYLTCIIVHLKAGSTTADQADRAVMTNTLMQNLNSISNPGDFTVSGDFNIQANTEQSYQNLINFSNANIRLNDPIEAAGSWNNNAFYKGIHTQSTHSTSNGCAASGGMDDRFDFILTSNSIITGSKHYTYIPGTYKALGNDGEHFNQAINSGTNNSVPTNVVEALFNISDHLPVIMQLEVDKQIVGIQSVTPAKQSLTVKNPVNDRLEIQFASPITSNTGIKIYSIAGQELTSEKIPSGSTSFISGFNGAKGVYILTVSNDKMEYRQLIVKE